VTRLGLPSIVVTIGTMSLFRGISFIILGDQAFKGYPASFAFFGQGYVWWVVSFEFVLFLAMAVVYYVLLHRTSFGRRVFTIGNNPTAAQFSGVRVERIKFMLFCLTGLMAGIAAVLLTSRLGSTRPSIAQGWELEVITIPQWFPYRSNRTGQGNYVIRGIGGNRVLVLQDGLRIQDFPASNIGAVRRPVNVFCCEGWYEPTSVYGPTRASPPCPNRGLGVNGWPASARARSPASHPN